MVRIRRGRLGLDRSDYGCGPQPLLGLVNASVTIVALALGYLYFSLVDFRLATPTDDGRVTDGVDVSSSPGKEGSIHSTGLRAAAGKSSGDKSRDVDDTKEREDWDSAKSVVMGMINGYHLGIYQTFVGSLRATGFPGTIILGIASDAPHGTIEYLISQNVTIKYIENAKRCTYNGTKLNSGRVVNMQTEKGWKCTKDHPDYKLTWARFVHYKDWLEGCPECTDGVILSDVRDAYFQRDPFATAVERNQQHSLMLFEEDPALDATNWLTVIPVRSCRKYEFGRVPMLCSGSTMGSREGILKYLDTMREEFDHWKTREECRTSTKGDDQSIHNYLFYTGRLTHAISIPYRTGPINVVGHRAARISEQAQREAKEKGMDKVPRNFYVRDGNFNKWLPPEHGMINQETGLIVNLDGTPSAQIHQVDRFGWLNAGWLVEMKKLGWPYNKVMNERL